MVELVKLEVKEKEIAVSNPEIEKINKQTDEKNVSIDSDKVSDTPKPKTKKTEGASVKRGTNKEKK